MSKYIYSTLSNDQNYAVFMPAEKGRDARHPKQDGKSIYVCGQANVMHQKNFITPKGVLTIVEDAEYKALEKCNMFQRHVENGYITVEDKEFAPTDVAKKMEAKDKSAPITEGAAKAGSNKPSASEAEAENAEKPKRGRKKAK